MRARVDNRSTLPPGNPQTLLQDKTTPEGTPPPPAPGDTDDAEIIMVAVGAVERCCQLQWTRGLRRVEGEWGNDFCHNL